MENRTSRKDSLYHLDRVEETEDLEYAQDLDDPQDSLVAVDRDHGGGVGHACLLEESIRSWESFGNIGGRF